MFGYNSVFEWLDDFAAVTRIEKIRIPSLFIFSKDDPVILAETVDFDIHAKNENIISIYTKQGGHIAWFAGIIPRRWYPRPCMEYVAALEKIIK